MKITIGNGDFVLEDDYIYSENGEFLVEKENGTNDLVLSEENYSANNSFPNFNNGIFIGSQTTQSGNIINNTIGNNNYSGNIITGGNNTFGDQATTTINGISFTVKNKSIYIKAKSNSVNKIFLNDNELSINKNIEDKKEKNENTYSKINISDICCINIIGAGSLVVKKTRNLNENFKVDISGSGILFIHGENKLFSSIKSKISGSGNLTSKNIQTDTFQSKISGSGDLNLNKCKINEANFRISGMGDVNAINTKVINISKSVSGMGSINGI